MGRTYKEPETRPLAWRKVAMRCGMLGVTMGQLSRFLWPSATNRRAKLMHMLHRPQTIDPEMRRRLELALSMPIGTLSDSFGLAIVGLLPVPKGWHPAGDFGSPEDIDVRKGGENFETARALRIIRSSLLLHEREANFITPHGEPWVYVVPPEGLTGSL